MDEIFKPVFSDEISSGIIVIDDIQAAYGEKIKHVICELILKEELKKAGSYHFVRILSQEGAAVLPLLKTIKKDYNPENKKEKEWWKQVYTETEKVAGYYPGYLNAANASAKDFSENAIRILQLQAEGMTIRQIAQNMGLAETTIKYHATETYRKLNVRGKTDTVQKAKSLKII